MIKIVAKKYRFDKPLFIEEDALIGILTDAFSTSFELVFEPMNDREKLLASSATGDVFNGRELRTINKQLLLYIAHPDGRFERLEGLEDVVEAERIN